MTAKAYLQAFMSWECTLARISQISLLGVVKMKKLIYTVLDLVLMHCTYKLKITSKFVQPITDGFSVDFIGTVRLGMIPCCVNGIS